MNPISPPPGIVFVVDDDATIRAALDSLLRSVGLQVACFASASEFLAAPRPAGPACLVLDVRLPEVNGLDLQQALAQSPDTALPVIMITGHGDIRMSVRAMKAGAVEFLSKPFLESELLDAIHTALARDARQRGARSERTRMQRRYDQLSPREREVLALAIDGRLNKQIAATLQLSEVTVKVHRRHVMQKMQVGSLAELVRCIERLHGTSAAR